MFSLNRLMIAVVAATSLLAGNSFATVLIEIQPVNAEVTVGQGFTLSIRATIPEPVVGWGLDLNYDHAVLQATGAPMIGPLWMAAGTPDGDGLAGLAFPFSISGTSVLLATMSFSAIALGQTDLTLSITPGDLTEGFPLDPAGFAQVTFQPAHVVVTPEPCSSMLSVAVCVAFLGMRRKLTWR